MPCEQEIIAWRQSRFLLLQERQICLEIAMSEGTERW